MRVADDAGMRLKAQMNFERFPLSTFVPIVTTYGMHTFLSSTAFLSSSESFAYSSAFKLKRVRPACGARHHEEQRQCAAQWCVLCACCAYRSRASVTGARALPSAEWAGRPAHARQSLMQRRAQRVR